MVLCLWRVLSWDGLFFHFQSSLPSPDLNTAKQFSLSFFVGVKTDIRAF